MSPEAAKGDVALCFPNTRAIARNNLGYLIVRSMLLSMDFVRLHEFWLSGGEGGGSLASTPGAPPLSRCGIVLFSVSYEGDLPNVMKMLSQGGLSQLSIDREADDPPVCGGGAAVAINPAPFAGVFDFIVHGEAEAVLPVLMDRWRPALEGETRIAVDEIERLPFVISTPSVMQRVWRKGPGGLHARSCLNSFGLFRATESITPQAARKYDPEDLFGPCDGKVLPGEASMGMMLDFKGLGRITPPQADVGAQPSLHVHRLQGKRAFSAHVLAEVERGCRRACVFCAASTIYSPRRTVDLNDLGEVILRESHAGETVGLLGLSPAEVEGIDRLARRLKNEGRRVALGSLPPALTQDRIAAEIAAASGTKTATIAPEVGSERLRFALGKPFPDDEIVSFASRLARSGVKQIRCYFIIGLPGERDEDVRSIGVLLRRLREACPSSTSLAATLNPFVPMPRTPLQWAAAPRESLLRRRVQMVRVSCPDGVRLKVKSLKAARWHALLARGDYRWATFLSKWPGGISGGLRWWGLQRSDVLGPIEPGAPTPWDYLGAPEEPELHLKRWRKYAREVGLE